MNDFVCENRIWQPDHETMPGKDLRHLQLQRLRDVVRRVEHVPFYEEAFDEAGITHEDIQSLDDVRRLPFTTKADLRDNYPFGFLAVHREDLARIHGSSGTTGKPTFVAYTHRDLDNWSNLCARFLTAGGLRPEHTVIISFTYGLFTGGFGLHYGVEQVGASVVPASSGNTSRQLDLLQDLQPETMVCTPSYALYLADVARQEGLDPADLPLQYAHFGGEPWTDDMRERIEDELDILAFNNYGLSEVMGPGVSGECPARNGMHIQEDHFLVECLDPDTLQPVPEGEEGELVITTLGREAMPLVRYRTRDVASLDRSVCPCGRTGARMGRVVGRTDDMLIIRGVNVFPSQIEEALLQVDGTAPHYLIEVDRPGNLDEVTVHVEVREENFSDRMSEMQQLRDAIARKIQSITGLRMDIELTAPRTLERTAGKSKRVIDHRLEE
mgnify:FL=1